MNNTVLISLSAMLLMFLMLGSADALPVDGVLSGWEPDTIFFDFTYDGRSLTGQIEYAVYDDYPGFGISIEHYVYAYRITNSELSNVDIDSFSIGILDNATVGALGYDNYEVSDGIRPAHAYFSPNTSSAQSAIFLFTPSSVLSGNGQIEDGDESYNLFFTSPYAPREKDTEYPGYGVIQGGSMGGMVSGLATPLPEPATILLLGVGGALVTMMRNRNR